MIAFRAGGRGISVVELLAVVTLVALLAALLAPQLLHAYERARQRATMMGMRSIAAANGSFRLDTGAYAADLQDLMPVLVYPVPPEDGWGNDWDYAVLPGDSYALTSLGKDGVAGPAPPANWRGEPFEADLVLEGGSFVQAPEAQE